MAGGERAQSTIFNIVFMYLKVIIITDLERHLHKSTYLVGLEGPFLWSCTFPLQLETVDGVCSVKFRQRCILSRLETLHTLVNVVPGR